MANSLKLEFTHLPSANKVEFTAFLETFTDDYAAEWSSEKIFGRMDPVAQYKGTTRKINCSFTVPSESHEEAFVNHIKMSRLLQMMYPNYEYTGLVGVYTIVAPPLMRVKFNNLIANQKDSSLGLMGFIPGLKYDPNMDSNIFTLDDTTIDLARLRKYNNKFKKEDIPKEKEGKSVIGFQSLKVSFELNVLHTHGLGFNLIDLEDGKNKPPVPQFPHGFNILKGG